MKRTKHGRLSKLTAAERDQKQERNERRGRPKYRIELVEKRNRKGVVVSCVRFRVPVEEHLARLVAKGEA